MASTFQQQSLRRKVIYSVLILAILTGMLALRYVNTRYIHDIDAQARDLEIHEESLGEVELTGSALRLVFSSMLVVTSCALIRHSITLHIKYHANTCVTTYRS